MRRLYFLMSFFFVVFCSCESPQKENIIGSWKSNDSARIYFNKDGTFNVENISKSILFGNCKDKRLFSGAGIWKIRYLENIYKIELLFPRSNALPSGFACYLNIEKKFHLSNSSWILFFYGEDFDYKYIFFRSQ